MRLHTMQPVHLPGDPCRLIAFVLGVEADDLLAPVVIRPQVLGGTTHIVGDDGIGGVENSLSGPIVLVQHDDGGVGKRLFELVDVADIGTTEPVNGLIAIPHHRDVAMLLSQQQDESILGRVGVLIFVHQHMAKSSAVVLQHLGLGPQQLDSHEEQIVEVHGAGGQQSALILAIDFTDTSLIDVLRTGLIRIHIYQIVLGGTDDGMHGSGRKLLGVEIEVA